MSKAAYLHIIADCPPPAQEDRWLPRLGREKAINQEM